MKNFCDFAEEEGHVVGEKIKIEDVIDKEIYLTGYIIKESIYNKNKSGKYLTLEFTLDNQKHILFTGSDVLITQIEKYHKEIPFNTIIKKINKFYTLT